MQSLGEILRDKRLEKRISIDEVAKHLIQKKEVIEALENGNWGALPDAAYVKGFIKSYANFLGLDSSRLLALHRAEYDERKYVEKPQKRKKRLMFTPNLLAPLTFTAAVLLFLAYLLLQYTSIVDRPKLDISSTQDDITTAASVIEVAGKTDKEAIVSIYGQLVPVDQSGSFNYQIKLEDGRNVIEIVASKRLSPKAKVQRTVRLSR